MTDTLLVRVCSFFSLMNSLHCTQSILVLSTFIHLSSTFSFFFFAFFNLRSQYSIIKRESNDTYRSWFASIRLLWASLHHWISVLNSIINEERKWRRKDKRKWTSISIKFIRSTWNRERLVLFRMITKRMSNFIYWVWVLRTDETLFSWSVQRFNGHFRRKRSKSSFDEYRIQSNKSWGWHQYSFQF